MHRLNLYLNAWLLSYFLDQVLYEKGGRKFAFLSLSPLGCLPALRALNPDKANEGGCFEAASALALAHNNALTAVLTGLEHILKGFKYCNSNFYSWLDDRITHPAMYGTYAVPPPPPPNIITVFKFRIIGLSYITKSIFHYDYRKLMFIDCFIVIRITWIVDFFL